MTAQRIFTIDGDLSVPMLLCSRVFAVWAMATTSRSTSWLSRFSVTGTFETLPLPHGMEVRRDHVGAARLLIEGRSALSEVARPLARRSSGATPWLPLEPIVAEAARDPVWRRIDDALLAAFGLDASADDVEVLERLIEVNRLGDAA